MKTGIIISIVLSIALIVVAIVVRQGSGSKKTIGLQVEIAGSGGDELTVNEFLGNIGEVRNNNLALELSETDKISRQLFTDYITSKLENEGSASQLTPLAEKYASEILKREPVQLAKRTELRISEDSNENFIAYTNKVMALREKYKGVINKKFSGEEFMDVFDSNFQNFMIFTSIKYSEAATELLTISVPTSLSENHLQLINNYRESSNVSKIIAKMEENPVSALGALKTQADLGEAEELLLANVKFFLIDRNLPSYSQ